MACLVGYIAPAMPSVISSIGSFLNSSIPLGTMVVGGGSVAISLTGAQILGTTMATTLTGIMLFASDHRPKSNKAQNKQFWDAARKAGYDIKDPNVWDELNKIHRYIRQKKLDLGWKQLLELIKEFMG